LFSQEISYSASYASIIDTNLWMIRIAQLMYTMCQQIENKFSTNNKENFRNVGSADIKGIAFKWEQSF
ncbi:MAG: hypothetical protein SVY10_09130, partial [Thermodesulfobacteriota bacterium]|nr:hypothetical protein [Thermodesulfobacteriota bacterium]